MLVETEESTRRSQRGGAPLRPGVVLVFSGTTTHFNPFAFDAAPDGTTFVIGREGPIGRVLSDDRVSRRHAEVSLTPQGWRVRDLESRNGTFVDGGRVEGEIVSPSVRVIRAGDTVFVPSSDVGRVNFPSPDSSLIVGSSLRLAFDAVDRAAVASETLLLGGETGTGKELAAKRFHQRGPNARGPFVAVNCAAIPHGLAERLLFGAKRGTYSGATEDSVGHIQASDFGVLFLDEAGELDLQVQAKLLRVLETREVVPLGASHGARVSTRICVATHRDLRAASAAGHFRSDLYHRIAPPEVTLPPLRDRLDEITQHVTDAIQRAAPGLTAHSRLVEACLLRHWPGNVRELRKHLHDAASRAASEGSDRVRLEHLSATAGARLEAEARRHDDARGSDGAPVAPPKSRRPYVRHPDAMTRESLERVLAENAGNVALTARRLGMARSHLYRQLARFALRTRPPDEE